MCAFSEANSLSVDSKLCSSEDDIQAKMFAAAMARGKTFNIEKAVKPVTEIFHVS